MLGPVVQEHRDPVLAARPSGGRGVGSGAADAVTHEESGERVEWARVSG